MIDHALKRLPNSDLELAGWLLLRYCCEVRLAPNYALHTSSKNNIVQTGLKEDFCHVLKAAMAHRE